MANRVWITEFATVKAEAAASFAQLPALATHEPLDLSDGEPKLIPMDANTRYIRIVSEVQCAVSTTGKATVNDIMVPALTPEYFGVPSGTNISVVAVP